MDIYLLECNASSVLYKWYLLKCQDSRESNVCQSVAKNFYATMTSNMIIREQFPPFIQVQPEFPWYKNMDILTKHFITLCLESELNIKYTIWQYHRQVIDHGPGIYLINLNFCNLKKK